MIFSIEGCDRSGKTTLFDALRESAPSKCCFVANVPFDSRLYPVVDLLQVRTVALWAALYEPDRVYVCDRSPFVGNVVYAAAFGREPASYPEWEQELRVLYLDASDALLWARGATVQERLAASAYERCLPTWKHLRLDASRPTAELVEQAKAYVISEVRDARYASFGGRALEASPAGSRS